MTRPLKKAGFAQGVYEISSTQKERIGTLRITHDGRHFRYARAGASNLNSGMMGVATQPNSGWVHQTAPVVALNAMQIDLTVTAGGTLLENQLQGGFFMVSGPPGDAALGNIYEIEGNAVLAAGGTSLIITLSDPIRTALTASHQFTVQPSTWAYVIESATEETTPAGIPLTAVTALYYYWAQTKGNAAARVKADGSIDPSDPLYLDECAGFLTALVNTPTPNLRMVGHLAGLQRLAANSEYAWPVVIDVEG